MSFIIFLLGKLTDNPQYDDGYLFNQVMADLDQLTLKQAEHYVQNFSPSKLGRLGFLGLRKLAMIKRDEPDNWKAWEREYQKLKEEGLFTEEDERDAKEHDIAYQYLRKAIELVGVEKVELWLQKFKRMSRWA